MNTCRDWAFSNSGFGSVAASLSDAHVRKMWRIAERRFVRHVCSRNPFPLFHVGFPSIHSARSRFLRAAVRSTSSALWLHYACKRSHPFVATSEKNTCFMQRSKAFGHAVVVSKICYNTVIVLSVVLWDCCKPMSNCRDWALSHIGLEVWLPAFQLPMFAKCDALPCQQKLASFSTSTSHG